MPEVVTYSMYGSSYSEAWREGYAHCEAVCDLEGYAHMHTVRPCATWRAKHTVRPCVTWRATHTCTL